MPIITLTTDLGTKDHYVSTIKGAIYSLFPEAKVIDISHQIEPFNLIQAAFVLKNSFVNFPDGSVHIIGVNTDYDDNTRHLAINASNHYFIGADNGIFSLIFDKTPDDIVTLDNIVQDTDILTFPTKDLFVKAACHLARGGTIDALGKKVDKIRDTASLQPTFEKSVIKGSVVYIDSYGNVVTNITNSLFKEVGKGRKFLINYSRNESVDVLSEKYNDVPQGELLCLFSSSGCLEIVINRGNASGLLGLNIGDIIRIEFDGN